jgi:hypothetical protein
VEEVVKTRIKLAAFNLAALVAVVASLGAANKWG